MTDIPLYEISQLSFSYDRKPALRCAGLALCPGQATAFVGANGSGKTTLLKLLNGLIGPYSGSVRFLGRELAESRELRSRRIYLHQHPVMFTGTVRDRKSVVWGKSVDVGGWRIIKKQRACI